MTTTKIKALVAGENHTAVAVPQYDYTNGQHVAYTATAAPGNVLDADNDTPVNLCATTDCYVTVAASPTATVGAGSFYLPAGHERAEIIPAGHKVSVIRKDANGALSILPIVTE